MSHLRTTCGKTFTRQDNLLRHQRQDHGGGPQYPCGTCGRGFKRLANLKRHERKVHGPSHPYHHTKRDNHTTIVPSVPDQRSDLVQEFVELGLPMSTTSNEACKLYDASLAQFAGGYSDTSMGGMEASLTRMLAADPEFVMAHVVKNASELMGIGRSIVLDAELKRDIDTMVTLSDRPTVNPREQKHVRALQLWANGDLTAACSTWEEILLDYPLDMLAIKLSQEGYFYLGMHPQMRDSVARCIRLWKPTIPLYSYLFGMHAFGLEETNLYPQAEKAGRKALELNKSDAWATHALCHVMEMEGRQDEGIQFLSSTLNDWENCGIAGHNFWHWALYHIEKNDHQGALDIFDGNVKKRLQGPPSMLAIIDGASLLYRLEMEGVDVKERWNDVVEVCRPHVDDHITTFNDLHILMGCLGAKSKETTDKMMASLKEFVRDGCGTNHGLTRDIGLSMCEAFVAYDSGDYGTAVDLMYGLRYEIIKIGGSHAQRDIFNLFLINAALKSPEKEHRKLARHLLAERKALRENAPMTDRLIARAMASHVD